MSIYYPRPRGSMNEPNPLRRGWSREVISDNIAEMMRKGYEQDQAVAASLSSARRSYRQRHPRGSLPRHLRRARANPHVALTYGKMPTKKQFEASFERLVPDGQYEIRLSLADLEAAESTIIGDGLYDADELYKGVRQLTKKWDRGDEAAGDLASSILYTLEFEWI